MPPLGKRSADSARNAGHTRGRCAAEASLPALNAGSETSVRSIRPFSPVVPTAKERQRVLVTSHANRGSSASLFLRPYSLAQGYEEETLDLLDALRCRWQRRVFEDTLANPYGH